MTGSGTAIDRDEDRIGEYLREVADTLRPFKTCEKVGENIYLLQADGEVSVGRKLTKELLSHGYAVESCHNSTLRVRKIGLSGNQLEFES